MCCHDMSRRTFVIGTGAAVAAGMAASKAAAQTGEPWPAGYWDSERPYQRDNRPLRVLPVLMYRTPTPREARSWKSWGGVQTPEAAAEEVNRISGELAALQEEADFPVEVLPVVKVKEESETARVRKQEADLVILYPAAGSGQMLRDCVQGRDAIVFVRHRSGPVYYWYEALSTRYLEKTDAPPHEGATAPLSVHDVVVDDTAELLWRMRAVRAVRNTRGTRVLALGGPWGKYAAEAPEVAREKYGLEVIDLPYDDIAPRLAAMLEDEARLRLARQWTDAYLNLPGTTLDTKREFVVNGFLLYGLFKDLMREHHAGAFTIKDCMSIILPMAKTTACLTLGLLNDEGLLSFCESDFVIIPAGILLHHIARKPVFLHNSTFPHKGVVTCAHCSSPRRFNGGRYEPTRVMTHYESEYGAAPKVDIPVGQKVTFIDPEYATGRWVGMTGSVEDNPLLDICRSQQDVRIDGDWRKLLDEVRDSHWVMCYGGYLREAGYAARKLGVDWQDISTV